MSAASRLKHCNEAREQHPDNQPLLIWPCTQGWPKYMLCFRERLGTPVLVTTTTLASTPYQHFLKCWGALQGGLATTSEI